MKRAPELDMTEKEYRRMVRHRIVEAHRLLNEVTEVSEYLPSDTNAKRRVSRLSQSIGDLQNDLRPFWENY